MSIQSKNPYTGDLIATYEAWDENLISEAISRAADRFESWRDTSFEERREKVNRLAELLEDNKQELARTITTEMGKPIGEAVAEIRKCAWVCEYYGKNAERFLARDEIDTDAGKSYVRYDPLGVILAVMPWNFPFWQVFRFAAPTVMAGNTALLKHASNVQGCAKAIEKMFADAGFPEGVFINIPIGSSQVKYIIDDDRVKAVTLTGSEKAGAAVASQAASKIKKSVLELGGSNAFVVLNDADIDLAVEVGLKARMQNGGQSCIAAKRFIVQQNVADEFIRRITLATKQLRVGDPFDENTDIGPLSSLEQAKEVEDQVKRSIDSGAELVLGGKRDQCFYYPTLLLNINEEMAVFREEVFGPVLSVILADHDEEILRLVNNSRFGLGATVMTNNPARAEYFIERIKDGAVFVNELVKSDPRLPFGGTGKSGYGRELSWQGIHEFVNCKTIFINNL